MKRKSIFTVIITFAMSLQLMAQMSMAAFAETTDNIKVQIDEFVNGHSDTTAGLSLAVFDKDNTVYNGYYGYSDIENKIPVDKDTVMEWGSVSKLLIWISVMQLKEQGLIDLETDVKEYLPDDFAQKLHYAKTITILDLMNHKAGFEERITGLFTGDPDRLMSLEEMLIAAEPPQIFEPGTVCAYSNWGTCLAGHIVSCVSGMPYEDYVHKNIFQPLGMDHTAILPDSSDNEWVKDKRQALKIYTADTTEIKPNISYINAYPAGACMSDMDDLQKFAMSLLDENTVLFNSADTYKELFTPTAYFGETDIGRSYHGFWGLEFFGCHVIGHHGNTAGCSSALLLDLEKGIGMTIMTNQANEQCYNFEMPEIIFGKYDGETTDYEGLVRNARSIFSGPLKAYSLMNVISVTHENTQGALSVRTDKNGPDRLVQSYGDYLIIDGSSVVPAYVFAIIYVIAVVSSVLLLITGLFRLVKHKNEALSAWYIVSPAIQLVPVVILGLMIPTLFNFHQWSMLSYKISIGMICAVLIANVPLIICGSRNILTKNAPTFRALVTVFTLFFSSLGIIYWNLFEFWKI